MCIPPVFKQADGPVCGQSPNGGSFFKRDQTLPPRELSPAEEAIKRRQFNPQKIKASVAAESE